MTHHPALPAAELTTAELAAALAAALAEVGGPGTGFGHRQHVHLAFIAARRYGPDRAPEVLCDWIGQLARQSGRPTKYHATMTIAWARVVAHHVAADPSAGEFGAFADRHPALLDKGLLGRHYTASALRSDAARAGWVPPDLAALP